jgi:hypothetical protein
LWCMQELTAAGYTYEGYVPSCYVC